MPKKQIVGSIIILIILSFICMYIYDNYHVVKQTKLIVESGNNNETIVNYYDTKKTNYYLYNIDNIIVDFSDRKLDLSKALELKQFSIEDILNFVEEKVNMNDGNVILYQNDDFSLLQCNLPNGKTNYIFGSKSMVYKESFCEETPYFCTFTKTYHVLDISDKKDDDEYVYLTLKNDVTEEVATIEIEKEKIEDAIAGNYYSFKFASSNDQIDGDIKSIFDNNRILSLKLIEAEEEKVNENICK